MKILHLILISLMISSCNHSLKKSLGLVRETPDEFKVISQPDLTMPPDFDLVPPQYPIESYQFNAKTTENHETIHVYNSDELEFLNNIGLDKKDNEIRKQIYIEQKHTDYTTDYSIKNRLDAIVHPEKQRTKVIDPVAENERIKRNLGENKPLTEGEVKSIKKEKSVVDKILGD